MRQIEESAPPPDSLIAPFGEMEMHYTDAFTVKIDGPVSLSEFIDRFYQTPLFRAERFILKWLAKAPSTRADVTALANGTTDRFALWRVDTRRAGEILLSAADGRTKSWLRADPVEGGTQLWFGSIVVPERNRWGKLVMGPVFDTLQRPHKIYSRMLLGTAVAKFHRKYPPKSNVMFGQKPG